MAAAPMKPKPEAAPTKKVLVRKKKPKLEPSDLPKTLQCVDQYSKGRTIDEIAKLFGWETSSVRSAINKYFTNLKILLETEALVTAQKNDAGQMVAKTTRQLNTFKNQRKHDEDINKHFLEKLSDPEETLLTNEEVMFCYLSVHEGNAEKALIDSGLSGGLNRGAEGYKRALKLRILMLKGKTNIIKYINGLQIDYARELNVNKEMIQTTIMRQISQLTEQDDPRNAPTIAKLTEQLGRTVGAFSDKITIEEVSFDDAMDRMVEMRKEQNKEQGIAAETYVYDPSKIG